MYPVTDAVKALFEAEQKQLLRITFTDSGNVSHTITEEDVMQGGFLIDRYACTGSKLEVGTAVSAEMTLKLDNRSGQFDGVTFEGIEMFVEIGIADWDDEEPTVTWIPCGYFTCYEQPRNQSTITIHALDRMMKFDVVQPGLTPWTSSSGATMTDNNGTPIDFSAALILPATVTNLIGQVCTRCGVTFDQNISVFPNATYWISKLPDLQQQITMRNLIQWCAGMMAANAWIDWAGKLRFSWFNNATSYTCTKANRFSSDLNEDDITVTGASYTTSDGVTIVSGTSNYTLDFTNNYMIMADVNVLLPGIRTQINGFTYRPFAASVINAPYLWPMDVIVFTDKDGINRSTVLTNVNFGINGTTAIAGRGETAQANSGTSPSSMTQAQAVMMEQVATNVKGLDSSLNQQGIFNRLTNNGEIQGLLLYEGKVYLNASYINAGEMNADRLTAGSITASKLAADSVTAAKIQANAITTDKLATKAVTTDKIDVGAITADRIAAGAINANMITSGTMSANRISGGTIDATNVTITNLNASNIKSGTIASTNGNSSWNLGTGWFTTSGSASNHTFSIDIYDGQIEISYDNNDIGLIDGANGSLGISGNSVWIYNDSQDGQITLNTNGITFNGDLIAGDAVGTYNVGLTRSVTISGTTLTFAQGLLVRVS